MKNLKSIVSILVLVFGVSISVQGQDTMMKDSKVTTITLEQTAGEFTQQNVALTPGDYVFAIANNNAGVDVGFVLVPAGKDASNPENHIKTAYVNKVVANGKTETTGVVSLPQGEYVYFCPLNKTPHYTLTVK